MDAFMASITSSHLPRSRTAVLQRSYTLFHGRKFLKLLKRRMVGQAVPEIPLSVGSKLELLLSLPNFRILPRTLTHLFAYAYCHVISITWQRRRGFCTLVPSLTLGAHAPEGLRYLSCLFVCLSVRLLPLNRGHRSFSTVYLRYVRHSFRLSFIFNTWIFEKTFRSKVMARKSQYANEQLPFATGFSPFRVPCTL